MRIVLAHPSVGAAIWLELPSVKASAWSLLLQIATSPPSTSCGAGASVLQV